MNDRESPRTQSPVSSRQFSFNECHIVMENVLHCKEKSSFLVRLKTLRANTDDVTLMQDLLSLYNKILHLTDDEYQVLRQDAEKANVIFPPNYIVSGQGT